MTSPVPRPAASPEPELHLPVPMREAMIRHARWCHPRECCGLLATGGDGKVRMVYPLTNAADSSVRFTIEPREHFGALRHADRSGWAIGGVFHSHPGGEAILSPTDLSQPHDPAWVHVVVGLRPDEHVRAWRIEEGRPVEIAIR